MSINGSSCHVYTTGAIFESDLNTSDSGLMATVPRVRQEFVESDIALEYST